MTVTLQRTKFAILFFVITLLLTGCGSYCDCPAYDIDIDEVSLVRKLKKLKRKYPEYYVELTDSVGNKYNPDGHDDLFYYCMAFKMPMGADTTVIIKILINVADLDNRNINVESDKARSKNTKTKLLIQAYSFTNGNSWRINSQHVGGKEEQDKVLKTFEKEILDKLGVKYRKRWFV